MRSRPAVFARWLLVALLAGCAPQQSRSGQGSPEAKVIDLTFEADTHLWGDIVDTPDSPARDADGQLTRASVQLYMRSAMMLVQVCYLGALEEHPQVKGSLRVKLRVSEQGRVSDVSATGIPAPKLAACVERHYRALAFPASPMGFAVTYPIILSGKPAGL